MNYHISLLAGITMIVLIAGCGNQSDNGGTNGPDETRVVEDPPQPPPPCEPNAEKGELAIDDSITQTETNWCWAACGQMVMQFVGDTTITQCVQANSLLEREDCCDRPDDCNSVGFIEFAKFGFAADSTASQALTWEQIREQIDCRKSPICVSRRYRYINMGHLVVASGYTITDGQRNVLIRNPQSEAAYLIPYHLSESNPFEQYDSTTWYVHGNDYYNIRKLSRE